MNPGVFRFAGAQIEGTVDANSLTNTQKPLVERGSPGEEARWRPGQHFEPRNTGNPLENSLGAQGGSWKSNRRLIQSRREM